MNFKERLNDLTTEALKKVFSALKLKCPSRKAERVEELYRAWAMSPKSFVKILSEPERLMLADCAHDELSTVSPARLKARHGLDFSFGYKLDGYSRDPKFIWLFVYYESEEYRLIDGVGEVLKRLLPAPPALAMKISKPSENEKLVFASEKAVFTELKRMLQLVDAGKLKVSEKTGHPSAASMRTVAKALMEPESEVGPYRSFIWPILLQQCGWAKFRAGKFGLTPTGRSIMKEMTPEAFATGVTTLMKDKKFDEMLRVSEIKGYRGKMARRHWNKVEFRRFGIFEALGQCPVEQWVHIKDAYDFLIASGEDCTVVSEGYALYIGDAQYGTLGGQEDEIGKVYFRQFICESFATLGLIDLLHTEGNHHRVDISECWGLDWIDQLTRYDEITHIRLTPLGHYCLGEDPGDYKTPEIEQKTVFTVLPNMEIVVTDPLTFSPGDAAQLERIAKKKSDAVWKMDKKTIFKTLEDGDTAEDVTTILSAGSANDLPQTVKQLISEVVNRSSLAKSREEALAVTFKDEHTAVLVENERSVSPIILGRNGCTLFVPSKNIKKLQSGLRKLGILLP